MATSSHFTFEEWKDPRCVGVHKEQPRATFFPCETTAVAAAAASLGSSLAPPAVSALSRRYVDLNSPSAWAFKWFPSAAACVASGDIDGAASASALASAAADGWTTMPVPGNWELQAPTLAAGADGTGAGGSGAPRTRDLPFPIYTNIGYAWAGGGKATAPPAIAYNEDGLHPHGPPTDYNPTAIYHRTLPLPADFRASGDLVFLHVGAVSGWGANGCCVFFALLVAWTCEDSHVRPLADATPPPSPLPFIEPHGSCFTWRCSRGSQVTSCVYVRVNGVDVGFSNDSRLPAEFDITSALLGTTAIDPAKTPGEGSSGDGALVCSVTLVVMCWSAGSFLEDQDMWHLAGLRAPAPHLLRASPPLFLPLIPVCSTPQSRVVSRYASLSSSPSSTVPALCRRPPKASRATYTSSAAQRYTCATSSRPAPSFRRRTAARALPLAWAAGAAVGA